MFIPFWCASKMSISIMPKLRQPELELFVCPRAILLANGNTRLRIVAVTFGRFLKRLLILIPQVGVVFCARNVISYVDLFLQSAPVLVNRSNKPLGSVTREVEC